MTKKNLRAMRLKPGTIVEDSRTVEIVFTSGASVKRYDWDGRPFQETLIVDENSVNLERMNAGAPLLNTHSSWSVTDVIGVVEEAWIDDGIGYARVRFSERDDVTDIWNDVKAGVLRNLSVGYSIDNSEMIVDADGEREMRVTSWTPHEVSIVPVPADTKSQFRALETAPEIAVVRADDDEDEDEDDKTSSDKSSDEASDEDGSDDTSTDEGATETPSETDAPSDDENDDSKTELVNDETDSVVDEDEDEDDVKDKDERISPADIVRRCVEAGVADQAAAIIESNPTRSAFDMRLSEISEVRSLCERFKQDPSKFSNKSVDAVRKEILDTIISGDENIQSRFASESSLPEKQARKENPLNPSKIYAKYRKS
ncbi:HK97 family phage prohead protease [Sulfitobacter sp. M22]|uniref:HK97 family phage prohead protease n=1 Tax=Sulfitobacter sp. M22 TaxID=2675332 RepID=UPI001F42547A|nr:HK97 family phage prohead protease [Sulfitobacter sp. M22]MCF7728663.1 hypothetical protein [Sulfitobacter sp. M22]